MQHGYVNGARTRLGSAIFRQIILIACARNYLLTLTREYYTEFITEIVFKIDNTSIWVNMFGTCDWFSVFVLNSFIPFVMKLF